MSYTSRIQSSIQLQIMTLRVSQKRCGRTELVKKPSKEGKSWWSHGGRLQSCSLHVTAQCYPPWNQGAGHATSRCQLFLNLWAIVVPAATARLFLPSAQCSLVVASGLVTGKKQKLKLQRSWKGFKNLNLAPRRPTLGKNYFFQFKK